MVHSLTEMPELKDVLPGRPGAIVTDVLHAVKGLPLKAPFPEGLQTAVFAMGCFWGVEKLLWERIGVSVTAVGYTGGFTPNPTYEEVCTGLTGHAEVVLVVFDPNVVSYFDLLRIFWEKHDPTSGMKQGEDTGTQYRSAIYFVDETQRQLAERSKDRYARELALHGKGAITTEVTPLGPFYYAEDYHQAYLSKNPGCYCGMVNTGVEFPVDREEDL